MPKFKIGDEVAFNDPFVNGKSGTVIGITTWRTRDSEGKLGESVSYTIEYQLTTQSTTNLSEEDIELF